MIKERFLNNPNLLRFIYLLGRCSVIVFVVPFYLVFVNHVTAENLSSGLASPPTTGTLAPLPPAVLPSSPSMLPTPPPRLQASEQLEDQGFAPMPLASPRLQSPKVSQNASSATWGNPPLLNQGMNLTAQQMVTMQMLGGQTAGHMISPPQQHQGLVQAQGHPAYQQIYPAAQGYNPYLAGYGFSPSPHYNPIYADLYGDMEEEEDEYEDGEIPPNRYADPHSGIVDSPYMPIRSPLLETTWNTVGLMNPFNAPKGIHRNVGQPLEAESWLDHPYYVGVFGGWVSGDTLVEGVIEQDSGGNGGIMFGRHLNHYWGYELRLFGASVDIEDTEGTSHGSSKLSALDISMHYYPYGEARWRPYLKLGIGTAREKFLDQEINTWSVPVGIGVKYFWSDRMSVHADIVDNIVFGKDRTKTHGEISINFGVSYMFGTNPHRHPTIYWPHTPSKPY